MNAKNVMFFILGIVLTGLSLKLFIFFFKNGGLEIGMSSAGTQSLNPKANASRDEQLQLVLRAILIFIIGIVLLYTQIDPLLGR